MLFFSIILLSVSSIGYFMLGVFFYMGKFESYGYGLNDFVFYNKHIFYVASLVSLFLSKLFRFIKIKYFNIKYHDNPYANKIERGMEVIVYSGVLLSLSSLFWMLVFNFRK